jgi:hypothetical protein
MERKSKTTAERIKSIGAGTIRPAHIKRLREVPAAEFGLQELT